MKNYDGIRMGWKHDGIVRGIWTVDMAYTDRFFSVREHVFLERTTKEKVMYGPRKTWQAHLMEVKMYET